MMLTTSFSKASVAQHYVKIVNNTISTSGIHYESGYILPNELDSAKVCYIHILKDNGNKNNINKGIKPGAKFLIQEFSTNVKEIKFYDNTKDHLRYDCFREAEILIKVGDDFVKYVDATFVESAEINKNRQIILDEIKSSCSYDQDKKIFDFTKCPYSCIIDDKKYKSDKQYMVEPNTQITFLTTDHGIPNIILSAKDVTMINEPINGVAKKGDIVMWLKENWIIILCVLFVIVIIVFLAYKELKPSNTREKDFEDDSINGAGATKQKCQDKRGKMRESHDKVTKETSNTNLVAIHEVPTSVVDEKLHQELSDILASIETTQNAVSKQAAILESIRMLVSNTEDKKQLVQKIQELELEKKKSASAIAQRDMAMSDIEKLKKDIAQLKASSQIEGAVQVTEYSTFVSFAKKIVGECVEAENIGIKYWSILDNNDQQILNGFLSKFQIAKCSIDLAKWNGIIATLDLKGYVKNDEYVTYLTPLSDKDRMAFLMKRFFEDILRPYIGSTILFLEQIRTATKIGVSVACNENIEGFINSICTKCYEQGVLIDYRRLYEKVTEYDTLEIDENIPDAIKNVIGKIEGEDILLYVDKYAVNLKSGEIAEKTRCYIKI